MTISVGTILECQDVRKDYGALAAVDGVSLAIGPGETVGIGGPNGAGKTTFFDLLSGLTPVSGGQVLFNKKPIAGIAPHKLFHRGLARTFQVSAGFTSLSVYQNMLASLVYGKPDNVGGLFFSRSLGDEAMAALETFGLASLANVAVGEIPALARKKLMVATAVVHQPRILLLDEPVGGLTPAEVDEFIDLIDALKDRGIGIVFIEHVMRFLTRVADRAIIMHQGRIIYDGPPFGIAEDQTVRAVYLGDEADAMQARQ